MKPFANNCVIIQNLKKMRRDGKTTRLINDAIEEMFKKGKICVPLKHPKSIKELKDAMAKDFFKDTKTKIFIDEDSKITNSIQKNFRERLVRRLDTEHTGYFMCSGEMIFKVIV